MQVSVSITNLDKLQRIAERYPAVSEKHVNAAIIKSLGEVYAQMASITPVLTGRLREDFHTPHVKRFEGYIGSNLPYAKRVHNLYSPGTPYKNPSKNKNAVAGFLVYAANEARNRINEFFKQAIGDTLKEISR